jgi:hypothetical protein
MKVYDHTLKNSPSPPNNKYVTNNYPKSIPKFNTKISNKRNEFLWKLSIVFILVQLILAEIALVIILW